MATITGQNTTATEATTIEETGRHRHSTMTVIVSVVLAALVGFGLGWLAFHDSGTDASTVPEDVERLVEDFISATAEQDLDTWQATITDDFFSRRYMYEVRSQELSDFWSEDVDFKEYLRRLEYYGELEYEQIGDVLVTGDGPWSVVVGQRWYPEAHVVFEGSAAYSVVERDGAVRIDSEIFTGTVAFIGD